MTTGLALTAPQRGALIRGLESYLKQLYHRLSVREGLRQPADDVVREIDLVSEILDELES